MNSFGLGLVLNFTDNATSGMKRASQAFTEMNRMASQTVEESDRAVQSLTAAGLSMSIVGEQFVDTGSAIIGMYAKVAESVVQTGMSMQNYRMQLTALYGGADEGARVMKDIQKYAQESVFEIESLLPAVTTMKAVGIEALDEITTSSGKNTQKLLDYASDLAAMMPNMRNTYGTGVSATMGAFKEYIAEGNALSLKRGAGLNITEILGEAKGKTIEERTRQVADLVEAMNIVGYTAQLAGTPMQRLSNLQDAVFNTLANIADGGAFDAFNELLQRASDYVFRLTEDEDKMNKITQFASEVITDLITPLGKVLDYVIKLADSFIELVDTNPQLAKMISIAGAGVGVFLLVTGIVLKFAGSLFLLTSSLTQMGILGDKGISMLTVFGKAFSTLLTTVLPLIAVAGFLKIAWEENLFDIQGIVADTILIVKGLVDAFSDNSLSVENYRKLEEEGLLPFIETVLKVKYAVEQFFKGLVTGFKETSKNVIDAINAIVTAFDTITGGIFNITGAIGDLNYENWEKFGEFIGELAVMFAVYKIASTIMGIVNAIGKMSIVTTISAGVSTLVGFLRSLDIATRLASAGTWLLNAAMSANPMTLIVLGVMAVITALLLLRDHFDKLPQWVQNIVGPVLDFFQPVIGMVDGLVSKVAELFGFSGKSIDIEVNENSSTTGRNRVVHNTNTSNGRSSGGMIGADTGGYVKAEGALLLHPNELIVNDDLTQRLDSYLSKDNKGTQQIDNRVIFEAGSVVLKLENGSDAELERTAEKLMKIIARKTQVSNMSKRPITT